MLWWTLTQLKSKNPETRKLAVKKLGESGNAKVIEPLIRMLGDYEVRDAAVEALVKIGDIAVQPLIVALKDSNSKVRSLAPKALGRIGDARAVEPLITALKDSKSYDQYYAVVALGEIGDARAVDPLIAALKDDKENVRNGAVVALGMIGDVRAVEPLIVALKDGNYKIIVSALVKFGAMAVEPLIAALKNDNENVRRKATAVLGKIGDVRAVEPLIAALKDDSLSVRYEASSVLIDLKHHPTDQSQHALILIGHKEWDEVVELGASAVEPLVAYLKNDYDDDFDREEAAEALGEIGDVRAVEPLIAALKDDDCDVRDSAAEALVKFGVVAVEPLIATLKDDNRNMRDGAVEALVKIGTVAVEPLIAALKDDNENVLECVASALGEIGDARAIKPLLALVNKDAELSLLLALERLTSAPLGYSKDELSDLVTEIVDAFNREKPEAEEQSASQPKDSSPLAKFKKITTESPDVATYALCKKAIYAVPAIRETMVQKHYLAVSSKWASKQLIEGSPEEIASVVLKNLQRLKAQPGFQDFSVETYSDSDCAQISAVFTLGGFTFQPIRVWRSSEKMFVCGNAAFEPIEKKATLETKMVQKDDDSDKISSELIESGKPDVLGRLAQVMAGIHDERSRLPFVMALNYIKAVQYLDGCGEFTLEKLRRVYQIAGIDDSDTDTETARLWEQSKDILSSLAAGRGSGEPGGPEFLRFDLRQTFVEGITNAAPHCDIASREVRDWLSANTNLKK